MPVSLCLPASRRFQRSRLQCSSSTVRRTRWSTSRTASPCLSAAPKLWSPCGWKALVTTTLSFTVSTWRGYGASSTRTWLHSTPEKQTTASLLLYECVRACVRKTQVRMFARSKSVDEQLTKDKCVLFYFLLASVCLSSKTYVQMTSCLKVTAVFNASSATIHLRCYSKET